jgi:hypothetical protein
MGTIPKNTNFEYRPAHPQVPMIQYLAYFDTVMDAHPGRLLTEFAC